MLQSSLFGLNKGTRIAYRSRFRHLRTLWIDLSSSLKAVAEHKIVFATSSDVNVFFKIGLGERIGREPLELSFAELLKRLARHLDVKAGFLIASVRWLYPNL